MKDKDKNRDPERARKRARADARCALRKLGLLDLLEDISPGAQWPDAVRAQDFVRRLAHLLGDLSY